VKKKKTSSIFIMKVALLIHFAAVASAVAVSRSAPPDVQTFPGVSRKDAVIKKIRYGPHTLKKAVVR